MWVLWSREQHVRSCLSVQTNAVLMLLPADNLEEFGSEHYRRRTLYFTIGENDPLYKQCFMDADSPQAKRAKH